MKKKWIHYVVYVLLMLLIGLLPALAPITALGMRIIGILVGTIYAWCTLDMIWPSLIALILTGLSGYSSVNGLFAAAMSNTTLMMMFFLLLFGGIIAVSDVGHAIAIRIVNMKIAAGRPWVLSILLMMAAFIPGLIIGGIPAIIVCWSIIYGICDEIGIERKSPWVVFILFMTAFMGNNAMNVLPFQISVVAVMGVARAVDPSASIQYLPWIAYVLIFTIVTMLVATLVYKLLLRPDVSKLRDYKCNKKIEPLRIEQKVALWLLLVLVVLLMFPNIFPNTAIGAFLNKIGNVGIIAAVVAFSQLIMKDGKQMFPFKQIADRGLVWQLMIMCTSAMTISGSLTSADTGVSAYLAGLVNGLGGMGGATFALVLISLALIATNVLANNIIGIITVTVLFTLAPSLGIDPMMYTPLLLFAGNCGYMFPSSSTPAALLYGNPEWVDSKSIIKYSAILIVIVLVMFAVVGMPLAKVFF